MTEMIILKLFCSSVDIYNRYNKYINSSNITKEYINILQVIKEYYNKFEEHKYLSSDELRTWFHHLNPAIKDSELYDTIFDRLEALDISDTIAEEIVTNLIEKEYANKVINSLIPVVEDSAFRILHTEVRRLIEEYEDICQLKREEDANPFVEDDLEKLLEENVTGDGLSWRLNCLNNDLGKLRGSSLGHVFARPDTGKTSFLASEASYLASQLKEGECILWISNEEKGGKVKLRIYQACLNATMASIVANRERATEIYAERGGSNILLYDNALVTISILRKLIETHNPRVIIIDQGDKVAFPKDGEYSQTDRLQRLYQYYRELAKKYNCDIITAGQASGEAEGRKWLLMEHMNNSKTGKPGELDYAIGIGVSFAEGDEELRYIHMCKNKMHNGAHGKHTVLFDSSKARYKDI